MASQTNQTVDTQAHQTVDTQAHQTVDTQAHQTKNPLTPEVPSSSCRKRVKDDNATFFENLKDHMDEFIHASMDEHNTCFKNTMDKLFGISSKTDAVAEKQAEAKAVVEIHSPLQAAEAK